MILFLRLFIRDFFEGGGSNHRVLSKFVDTYNTLKKWMIRIFSNQYITFNGCSCSGGGYIFRKITRMSARHNHHFFQKKNNKAFQKIKKRHKNCKFGEGIKIKSSFSLLSLFYSFLSKLVLNIFLQINNIFLIFSGFM